MLYKVSKRIFDIAAALLAIVVFLILKLIICIAIKRDSPGSILFAQRRVGLNDREFVMYKFRSMAIGTPEVATHELTESHNYITRVGAFIRRTSLDELPQLYNILTGDMSLVGPRPALHSQHDLRELRNELGISTIKPGLTGWAQINGRDDIPLEKKVELDAYYLKHRSFLFDLKIIFLTIISVCKAHGIKH